MFLRLLLLKIRVGLQNLKKKPRFGSERKFSKYLWRKNVQKICMNLALIFRVEKLGDSKLIFFFYQN